MNKKIVMKPLRNSYFFFFFLFIKSNTTNLTFYYTDLITIQYYGDDTMGSERQ